MTLDEVRALTLGAKVRFRRTLRRKYRPAAPRSRRIWEPTPLEPWALTKAKTLEGIVVGRRTLHNGDVDDGYYDTPSVFYPTESVLAVLVAWRIDRKPVLVLPEDLERVGVTVSREDLEQAPADPIAVAQEVLFR